jgi:ATP-dependent DNA helicase RecG
VVELQPRYSEPEFKRLIEREHERLELKTGAGRRPLQETMVAFSNAEGGAILIGVTDQREVKGRSRDQGLDDDIHGAANDAHAVGRYEILELRVDQRPVVAVLVQPRTDEVAATSDGRILVRRGGHNRAVVGHDLRKLINERSLVRYEAGSSGLELGAVEATMMAALREAYEWPGESLEDRLRERGLLTDDGFLTVAGALVLTDPSRSLGTAKFHIDVRAYEADTGTSYVRRETVAGPVQVQVERATELVMRDIGTDMVITQSHRHDLPRLPRRVVREVIANAVAHRAYDIDRSPVAIELRPSRVIVTSPGGLPAPVTVETLRQAQAPRNHTVIAVLRRFGLAEDSGQGIDVIQDSMKLELLAEPEFTDDGSSVRVDLPLRGLISAEERGWLAEFTRQGLVRDQERRLLLEILRQEKITNSQARDVLAEDSTNARARLRRLRDAGLLVQHGTRGRAYYTLGSIAPRSSDEAVALQAAADSPLTNQRVRDLTGLDRVNARALLKRLVDEGRLIQVGERRATVYRLPPTGKKSR